MAGIDGREQGCVRNYSGCRTPGSSFSAMEDVLGYAGRRAVVTGAASGMGAAAAALLTELGAAVTAIDVKPVELAGATSLVVDLRDKAAIDEAVGAIGGPVDAVFSVAGLPGPPFSDLDTVKVNFIGARHLIDGLVPMMRPGSAVVCVASNAGLGWQQELDALLPLVSDTDFDGAVAWCEANPAAIAGGYLFSKKATNAWVAWRGTRLIADGIRLNCTNPGPTDTAMMPTFEAQAGKELIDAFIGPSGRRSTAEEQAWPMLFLNSPRSSYVAGEALHVDAGFLAAMTTRQL
jgi:NAD(P)-dependent dehydrogenase (short-subunit alcohol dehydrogenase family)